jgi:nucleoside-triphosphatase THEP1
MEPHMTTSPPGNSRGDSISIAALKHPEGTKIDRAIMKIVHRLRQQGYSLAGAVRAHMTPSDENRCDLFLEDLSTSTVFPISQDLGSGSHACRLDDVALDAIAAKVEVSLQEGADILILNKFGKQEAEGRGLRSPIVEAVNRGIPVLVGLNPGRAQAWNEFCGATGEIFDPDDTAVDRWLEANLPAEPRQ